MSTTAPDDRITEYSPVTATKEFPAAFPVFDNSDLIVVHNGVTRTDFTVSATYVAGVSNNAKAVFSTGITGDVKVVGNRASRRPKRFADGAPLPTRDQNLAFDVLQAEVQEARRDIGRAVKADYGDVAPSYSEFETLANETLAQIDEVKDVVNQIPNIARFRKYDVSNYDADPDVSPALNTLRIQQAINAAGVDGFGEVFIPFKGSGIYKIQASSETTILGGIGAGAGGTADPIYVGVAASSVVCLVLRPGVHIVCDDGVIIENQNTARSILGFKNMNGGGIHGGWWRSKWDWSAPDGGAGHGILAYCDTNPNNDPNMNLDFEDMRISNVASYGLGMGMGFLRNNRYRNIWVHDIGADCIDHKSRPTTGGDLPVGNIAENIVAERYGRRAGIAASTAIDIRGPLIVDRLVAREVAYSTNGNVGVRLSAGLNRLGVSPGATIDYRQPSQGAILTNVSVDAGDPSITGTKGIVMLDSGAIVDSGYVKNFETGVSFEDSSSGWGTNAGSNVSGVTVEGARAKAFDILSDRVTVENCFVCGQVESFESVRRNLSAGQTVFVSPRAFDPAAVQVYKNGTLLTLTTDYTVTGSNTITLTAGVLSNEFLEIVSPTPIGYDVLGAYSKVRNLRTRYVTSPRVISGNAGTLDEGGNSSELNAWTADYSTASGTAITEPRGPATDIERDYRVKGNAGHTFRSQGDRRAFRAYNTVADAVNWLEARGSATGVKLQLVASGTDANINMEMAPKGSGVFMIPLANVPNYADDAAAASGGVPVGGVYRTASALKIRAS